MTYNLYILDKAMETQKYITLGPKLHQMFQEKKRSAEIKKEFYQANDSIPPLSRKEDDMQMLWCYAAHYDHLQYMNDEKEAYNPCSKCQPLITAVRGNNIQMVIWLLELHITEYFEPDQRGYGIFDHGKLYVGKKTSALTEALKADDAVLLGTLREMCFGEIHGLLAMANQHNAENCIEYINDYLEGILGNIPTCSQLNSENYLDRVITVSQSCNGTVTELQQRSAWYLWSIAVKDFPVPDEHKNMFLCPHNREQIRDLLHDESKQKKFLKVQMRTRVIHASFPAQHTDEVYNSLHARIILDCFNRYLYNVKTPVQSKTFSYIIELMEGFFFCGQSLTDRKPSMVKASLKLMNMILYLVVKHQFVTNRDDQDYKSFPSYAEELCVMIDAASISEYLKKQAKTFMSMMAMSGYAKQMTHKQIIDATESCSLETVTGILKPFLCTYMSGLSQNQLEDFYTDIRGRIAPERQQQQISQQTEDIYRAVEHMRPLSLKDQWDLFTNAEMPEERHEVCLCSSNRGSSNTGSSFQIVQIVSYC